MGIKKSFLYLFIVAQFIYILSLYRLNFLGRCMGFALADIQAHLAVNTRKLIVKVFWHCIVNFWICLKNNFLWHVSKRTRATWHHARIRRFLASSCILPGI